MKLSVLVLVLLFFSACASQSVLSNSSNIETWEMEMAKFGYLRTSSSTLPLVGYKNKTWSLGRGQIQIIYKDGFKKVDSISYWVFANGSKSSKREMFHFNIKEFNLDDPNLSVKFLKESKVISKQLNYECSVNLTDVKFKVILGFIRAVIHNDHNEQLNYTLLFDVEKLRGETMSISERSITLKKLLEIACKKNNVQFRVGADALVLTLKNKAPTLIEENKNDFDPSKNEPYF